MTITAADDLAQRQLALDPRQSFIVQAPAGSGKTELLIQRFLTLLQYVNTPEEILAITFTKKAANEMRSRIIKALKQAFEPEPTSAHAKLTWQLATNVLKRDAELKWNIIANPNQLRIQTIDALCTFLTKQLPLLSHFGSQPDIAENPAILYRAAVQEILLHVEQHYDWSVAISQLLLHLDNDFNKLHHLLVNLLAKRDQWLPYIHLDLADDEIRMELEANLSLIITETLSALSQSFPKSLAEEIAAIARFAASHLALSQPDNEIAACHSLMTLPGTHTSDLIQWHGIAKLLLTKSHSWRKRIDNDIGFPPMASIKNKAEKELHQSYRQRLSDVINQLSDNEAVRLALVELSFLPDAYYEDEQWEILTALIHLLKIVVAQLRLTFQNFGQIDFIENAQAALLALGTDESPTDLALALDYSIRHILLDEFQDTSFSQNQLLEKLTSGWEMNDGRTLFIVGDPMQSIYRFRQAEVGLFIRMRQSGIGHMRLTPITLALNFRSTPSVVDWNNRHFQSIFPKFNDMTTGAVTYSSSITLNSIDADDQTTEMHMFGYCDAPDGYQANEMVQTIQTLHEQYPTERIAILVRSRSHLRYLIPALKKNAIPFNAVDIDPLASRQHIQDLLSLTCAMMHLSDRIAWLSILRAPWCGLSLADLLVIAGKNPYQTIWEQLTQSTLLSALSDDGKRRMQRIIPILKTKLQERERGNLRMWIESTWLLLGGPATLSDLSESEDTKSFFQLLSDLSQKQPILNLEKLKEKINKLYASTQHDHALVQIMTVHTSKGLEFDSVILPHLERKMPGDDKGLLSWMERPGQDGHSALLLAPIHSTGNAKDKLYEYIARQQRIKSDYEIDRLLYVAATRAKKRLYLYFDTEKKADGDYKIESGSFLSRIWPLLKNQQDNIIKQAVAIVDEPLITEREPIHIKRLIPDWQNPVNGSHVAVAYHQESAGFALVNRKPQYIGVATHRILQSLANNGLAWWQRQSSHEHKAYIAALLKQLGILPTELTFATQITLKAISNTISDERGLWILQPHHDAKSEYAISAVIDNQCHHYILDRTFVDENGIRWIIDYKTATLSEGELDVFLQTEYEKYIEKMAMYAKAIQLKDNRPIKLGLYFPAVPTWKEWETAMD